MIECLPKDATENRGAAECVRLIMAETSRHFVSWAKVGEIERKSHKCELDKLVCLRKSDMLFPGYRVDRKEWAKKMRDTLKEKLRGGIPDENTRRSIQARLFKNGRLTPEALKFLREQHLSSQVSDATRPDEAFIASGILYDFIGGQVSEAAFTERLLDSFADPVSLAALSAVPGFDSVFEISTFLWREMDRLGVVFSRLVLNLLEDQLKSLEFDYKRKVRPAIEGFTSGEKMRSVVAGRFFDSEFSSAELKAMPGSRLLVDVFCQYVLEVADRYANLQSPEFGAVPNLKRSDMADFTHVPYLPYVDIFGCDGAMRNRVKKAGWSIEKIVTSDFELEQKLSEFVRLD